MVPQVGRTPDPMSRRAGWGGPGRLIADGLDDEIGQSGMLSVLA